MAADLGTELKPRQPVSEAEQVESWRLDTALRAGCSLDVAQKLAAGDGELAVFRRLVAEGCPPDLAVAIV